MFASEKSLNVGPNGVITTTALGPDGANDPTLIVNPIVALLASPVTVKPVMSMLMSGTGPPGDGEKKMTSTAPSILVPTTFTVTFVSPGFTVAGELVTLVTCGEFVKPNPPLKPAAPKVTMNVLSGVGKSELRSVAVFTTTKCGPFPAPAATVTFATTSDVVAETTVAVTSDEGSGPLGVGIMMPTSVTPVRFDPPIVTWKALSNVLPLSEFGFSRLTSGKLPPPLVPPLICIVLNGVGTDALPPLGPNTTNARGPDRTPCATSTTAVALFPSPATVKLSMEILESGIGPF